MTESAQSDAKPMDVATLVARTIEALMEDRIIQDREQIVSTVHRHLPQGYPTPFRGRDAVVDSILRKFEEHDIWSRGRFGAWKYEVANQDHSFAQGYEWVERMIALGGPDQEPTLFTPADVNSRKNP
jgi:hypothetical protein